MYLQITTKCTMECDHCAYGCKIGKGEHMPKHIWKAAMNKIGEQGEIIAIGGGEPTMHPDFLEILMTAIAEFDHVWIATNGSIKKHALLLNKLAKKRVIEAELSTDWYHDHSKVDAEVYEAFAERGALRDGADNGISGQGNAVTELGLEKGEWQGDGRYHDSSTFSCACEGAHVRTNGDVTWCGCDDAPVMGNVMDEDFWIHDTHACWRSQEENEDEYDREIMEQVMDNLGTDFPTYAMARPWFNQNEAGIKQTWATEEGAA